MAPPISSVPTDPTPSARPALYDNTVRREAAQRVREAQDAQQQKADNTRKASAQVDEARRRLQATKTEEQQAAQRVRAAQADEQQAVSASQQQLRGNTINVVA